MRNSSWEDGEREETNKFCCWWENVWLIASTESLTYLNDDDDNDEEASAMNGISIDYDSTNNLRSDSILYL